MRGRTAALALLVAATSACAAHPLSFRQATQVRILSPASEAVVHVPVTLRWTSGLAHGTTYAVFVDRAPIQPGRTLKSLAQNDAACNRNPSCPDAQYLTQHYVFVTTAMQVSLGPLPFIGNRDRLNVHDVTIVVLDQSGRRRSEAAYSVRFRVSPAGSDGG